VPKSASFESGFIGVKKPKKIKILTQIDFKLIKKKIAMRDYQHPWNLRRIFGSQSVGGVAGSPRPEAGLATRVIPSQPSRWTFRGPSDADLATWRLGVLDSSHGSDVSPAFNSKVGNFAASFSSRPRLPSHGPAIVRTSSSVFRARRYLPQCSLFHWR